MLKLIFTTFCILANVSGVMAQSDTSVYYLQKSGKIVSTKDSADYYEFVFPSRATGNDGLFGVREFYKDGKIRVEGHASVNSAHPRLEGSYTGYFTNGKKMESANYVGGNLDGEEISYYPNGNFHCSKRYSPTGLLFVECRDSIGKVLAKEGNGKWVDFFLDDFHHNVWEGSVVDGKRDGEWHVKSNDSVKTVMMYKSNDMKWSYSIGNDGRHNFTGVETVPTFPGGLTAFYHFLSNNIVYPTSARQNNIQGRVIITFIVDTAGKLTELRVVRGIGSGCDEEALRVLSISPPWTPGLVDNKPVRVVYSVPINFTLGK